MARSNSQGLVASLVSIRDKVNGVSNNLIGESFFSIETQQSLNFTCSEAGFLRQISWLYSLYTEAARGNLDFILARIELYGLDDKGLCIAHLDKIHYLRTYLQHSLDMTEERNNLIKKNSESWIAQQCGVVTPTDEKEWQLCFDGIANEASLFLQMIYNCLAKISEDAFQDTIVDEWKFRLTRNYPPHKFEEIIAVVAADLGREHLDPILVCKQNFQKWTKQLALLPANFDFEQVVRRLVEDLLLTRPVLPITGTDIMRELKVAPGPSLGRILVRARELYIANPCPADELIQRLRDDLDNYHEP